MKAQIHPSTERGHANFGWLDSYHSFSFSSYHNPAKMGFGALRVLNDDTVAAGMGFGSHPHSDMEIVSIPLSGALKHEDNTGRKEIIKMGDVQIMSAGTGIVHSEYNASKEEPVKFLQIWVFPERQGLKPRYEQISFDVAGRNNRWQTVVSPDQEEGSIKIFQQAWFKLADVSKEKSLSYAMHGKDKGLYLFVLEGSVQVGEHTLGKRDALAIEDAESVDIQALEDSKLLAIEIPLYK
jgi:hypothetical protein